MGLEIFQIDEFQSRDVGRFKNHLGCHSSFERLFPTQNAQAPLVAWFETWETVMGDWGAQVVPSAARELEELGGHLSADQVHAVVFGSGMTATVPIKTCSWIERTGH